MKQDIFEECNVTITARDKNTKEILHYQEGHNVWTLNGREYSCMLKSYDSNRSQIRNDKVCYVGLGKGAQPESINVKSLVSPLKINNRGQWLKELDFSRTTFSSNEYKTSVRYVCVFTNDEIISDDPTVLISECGLFTDGLQNAPYTSGERVNSIQTALAQSPIAYHSFEPIPKNPNIQLEIIWELRH